MASLFRLNKRVVRKYLTYATSNSFHWEGHGWDSRSNTDANLQNYVFLRLLVYLIYM
jgi:hypothetical protein